MNIKFMNYTLTINISRNDIQPARRSTDPMPEIIIDTAKRDEMINDLGMDFDSLKARAQAARAKRAGAIAA